jgi:hypothetical protein
VVLADRVVSAGCGATVQMLGYDGTVVFGLMVDGRNGSKVG